MKNLNRKIALLGTIVLFATILVGIPITRVKSDSGDRSEAILAHQTILQESILQELKAIKLELQKSNATEHSKD